MVIFAVQYFLRDNSEGVATRRVTESIEMLTSVARRVVRVTELSVVKRHYVFPTS
jgi:hypothetical protein